MRRIEFPVEVGILFPFDLLTPVWKEQVPIRPRGSAPAWGALCRVEIAGYLGAVGATIQSIL
jgi:hypothetical protein